MSPGGEGGGTEKKEKKEESFVSVTAFELSRKKLERAKRAHSYLAAIEQSEVAVRAKACSS